MIQISHLYQLQKTDSELDRAKSRLTAIIEALSNDTRMRVLQEKIEKIDREYHQVQNNYQDLEERINQKKIKKELSSSALYSGKVTSPKELKSLEDEIASLNKQTTQLEDQLLEVMGQLEQLTNEKETMKLAKDDLEARIIVENAQLAGEKSQLDSLVLRLESERQVIVSQIPEELLSIYQALRLSKKGVAVALVEDESCLVCGAQLAPAEWQSVRSKSQVIYCRGCGRILYAG